MATPPDEEPLEGRSPVRRIPTDPPAEVLRRRVEEGMGLCLSGGGYRAMLFHLGTLWRLNDAGLLLRLERISSVSGGSITAGLLGLKWRELAMDDRNISSRFVAEVVEPLRRLARTTIDRGAIITGLLTPRVTIAQKLAKAYRRHLFGSATLQDLPDQPRFIINATNVQSGVLWRFMKPYMRDYRVGEIKRPRLQLSIAVAASSAFPPFLSPLHLKLEESDYTSGSGLDLQHRPYTTDVVLTDGGVYDNLGLETVWKRYRSVLVSDAGGKTEAEPDPKELWGRHSYRIFNLVDNQVRSLRKRQLIDSYIQDERQGAYWSIRSNIAHFKLDDPLPCDFNRTQELADVPTRLKRLPEQLQERLINWGYAACDAAIRRHFDPTIERPDDFPYPDSGI